MNFACNYGSFSGILLQNKALQGTWLYWISSYCGGRNSKSGHGSTLPSKKEQDFNF